MDLPINVDQFQTQNDVDARAIRSVMVQKREAVKRIEDEIAQLVENKRGLEEDIVCLGVTLAHHNHSLLASEVLSHIFILLSLSHGAVKFPVTKNNAPPQLAVSQVCSRWRGVALRDIIRHGDHNNYFHQRWVFRARTLPVTLSIDFDRSLQSTELTSALRNILLSIQVE